MVHKYLIVLFFYRAPTKICHSLAFISAEFHPFNELAYFEFEPNEYD